MLQVIRRVSTNICTAYGQDVLLESLSESGLEAGTVCQSYEDVVRVTFDAVMEVHRNILSKRLFVDRSVGGEGDDGSS